MNNPYHKKQTSTANNHDNDDDDDACEVKWNETTNNSVAHAVSSSFFDTDSDDDDKSNDAIVVGSKPGKPKQDTTSSSSDDDDSTSVQPPKQPKRTFVLNKVVTPPPRINRSNRSNTTLSVSNNINNTYFMNQTLNDNTKWNIVVHPLRQQSNWMSNQASQIANWSGDVTTVLNDGVPTIVDRRAHELIQSRTSANNHGHIGVMPLMVSKNLNPVTNRVFGDLLKDLGILGGINNASDIMMRGDDNVLVQSNKSLNFLFTVFPKVDKFASEENRLGQTIDHDNYWNGHMEHRPFGAEKGIFMELAMKIFAGLLPESERASHFNVFDGNEGPFMDGRFVCFVLYGSYAVVLCKIMSLPIVRAAYQHGWLPVLAIKNCVCQRDLKWGINGYKVASCNKQNKSFLSILGFHKQNVVGDETKFDCISIAYDGKPLAIKSNSFVN
jgi:hypothetical protein